MEYFVCILIFLGCFTFSFNLMLYHLTQGVIGIKVKIMLDWDPKGKMGPTKPLPDLVTIHPPKDDEVYARALVLSQEVELVDPISVA